MLFPNPSTYSHETFGDVLNANKIIIQQLKKKLLSLVENLCYKYIV